MSLFKVHELNIDSADDPQSALEGRSAPVSGPVEGTPPCRTAVVFPAGGRGMKEKV